MLVPFFFGKVVATHGFSSHNCVTEKVNKQVEGLGIKEQKSRETRNQLKICETREVTYTGKYASGHLILIW